MSKAQMDPTTKKWSEVIRIVDELRAEYPECVTSLMPEQDDGIDRFVDFAVLIKQANELGPNG
jgi:hypothetical protein